MAPLDQADACDQAGCRDLIVVHLPGRQRGDLQERAARVQQLIHALARKKLSPVDVTLPGPLRPSDRHLLETFAELRGELAHPVSCLLEALV